MIAAYETQNPQQFNMAVEEYRSLLDAQFSSPMHKVKFEHWINQSQIFYVALVLYLMVAITIFIGWLMESPLINRVAVWGLIWGFGIHTIAILSRMWILGRPPFTNLYTSAVFVGWVAIALGLILERVYKNGVGAMVSGVIGFSTLIIAHHLSLQGDTMEMMQAVLDSNFWLATHVVTICIGYGATFLAGFLALVYVLRGVFTRGLDSATRANIIRMIYAILCFALLFSLIGTVLGGIWADQSWGRFWGWDPKENGAMIIVLWNAAILHSRWGGLVRERGLIAMALFGNIVTSFSWFGVNMLGIGLHSYGFMDQAFLGLVAFVFSQLFLIWLAYLPPQFWRSNKG
jgi:ABC-type transport system involved in cytochrome c biogenesis permease subunit